MADERLTKREPVKWGSCPKGEWKHLSETLRSRHRKSMMLHIIAFAVAALAIAGVTWMLTAAPAPDPSVDSQAAPTCHPARSTESDSNDSQNGKP
jgi:hypothetical protein